jgi:glycosyltransferase involved in cell wall biosynthesis
MKAPNVHHIALIGNFLPRKCGLATYTTDTYAALKQRFPDLQVDVYAMDDHPGRYDYPEAVTRAIPEQDRAAYLDTARQIEASGAQALWIQHEYGIYGGPAGEYLIALLDRITIPVIATLHTVLENPNADQRRVMEALLRRASRVIVMAEKGREMLKRVHGADDRKITMIPHGVPDRAFADPEGFKPLFGWQGREVILTFGLLAPSKGIETMIEAMPAIAAEHPDSLYVILGATHPNLVAREGEAYRERLKALTEKLGVANHVAFVDGFVEQDELLDYLQAADVYATPYPNPAQITSGTLSYAVAVGKPVVSTPYIHASEILADDHGVLVPFNDSAAFAREISRLLADKDARTALAERAYARGRTMLWPRLAETAMAALVGIIAAKPRRFARPVKELAPLKPDIAAVERMSDATGMLQHSIYSVPDRRHGYCIDDNARALILMSKIDGDRRDAARQMDERLCRLRPICLEPGPAALPQLHELRPDLVRGRRLRGFERPRTLGIGRHGARRQSAEASRLGFGPVRRHRVDRAGAGQSAGTRLCDAGRRGDARCTSGAHAQPRDPHALRRRADHAAGRQSPAGMAMVRDRARL